MFKLYIYNGHWENGVFLRDSLNNKIDFKNIKDIRHYLTEINANFDEFDYLIESDNGGFNSIYRYNF